MIKLHFILFLSCCSSITFSQPSITKNDSCFNKTLTPKEIADYNFDGNNDYRIINQHNKTKWSYFVYNTIVKDFVIDTLLSSLDNCYFDFIKKEFVGLKAIKVTPLLTETKYYTYINGVITLYQQMDCLQAFHHSEKMDCTFYEVKNGKLVFKQIIKGCE